MVAHSIDDYIAKAIALAEDPASLAAVRAQLIQNRETTPLFDFPRYVRDLERAYEAIWHRHKNGQPPQLIDLKE